MEEDKRGRPTKFKPEYVNIIKKMCELGATVADVANGIGVAESTIYLWATKYQELQEAMRVGKEPANDRSKMSLYMSACGYERTEEEVKVLADGTVIRYDVRKWYPPHPTSLIYWTSNRMPDEFSRCKNSDDGGDQAPALTINFEVSEPVADIKVTRGKAKD